MEVLHHDTQQLLQHTMVTNAKPVTSVQLVHIETQNALKEPITHQLANLLYKIVSHAIQILTTS